jgi:hypothetical protein
MLVIGDGHDHCIDILAVEYLAVMARCGYLLLHGLLPGFMTAIVKVAHGDALDTRHGERCGEQFATARAGANRGETNPVAGRNRLTSAPQRCWLKQRDLRGRTSGCGGCANPHEMTACHKTHFSLLLRVPQPAAQDDAPT